MDQENDTTGRFIWFVAGAAIGASIALLYAPTTGRELRKMIGDKTDEGRAALTDSGREMLDRGRDLYERGRKIADEAADMFERGRKLVQG